MSNDPVNHPANYRDFLGSFQESLKKTAKNFNNKARH